MKKLWANNESGAVRRSAAEPSKDQAQESHG